MPSTSLNHQCSTGIAGLDDILRGGLTKNRFYLIEGNPGVGKTTLAMQFLLEGIKRGEKCLYITLSETKEEIHAVAESHQWDLSGLSIFEVSAIEQQLMAESRNTLFPPSEIELTETIKLLIDEVERIRPSRIVFDSLSEIRLLAQEPYRYRRQILSLKNYFIGKNCTTLLLDDNSNDRSAAEISSIVHGVISLQVDSPEYGADRRFLRVKKFRGVAFRGGRHDYLIQTGGLEVFPRLIAAEHPADFRFNRLSSGSEKLDALLGGGLDFGTSNLFLGASGSGKSTLAMLYACAAAEKGHHVVYLAFEEGLATLLARSKSLGLKFDQYVKEKKIQCRHIDPAELTPGEVAHSIRRSAEHEKTRMVVIDSVNGYMNAMPGEKFLNLQLRELLTYLNLQGVITIMVLTQHGLLGEMQLTIDLSYLADAVLLARYFEFAGTLKKAVTVIKKRSGPHENSIRELRITPENGIQVGEPLTELQGVFRGIPNFLGSGKHMLSS